MLFDRLLLTASGRLFIASHEMIKLLSVSLGLTLTHLILLLLLLSEVLLVHVVEVVVSLRCAVQHACVRLLAHLTLSPLPVLQVSNSCRYDVARRSLAPLQSNSIRLQSLS